MSESGKCHFGGSGIGKGAKFRVGNREKNSFWDRENGILEGRESDLFFSLREKNTSEIGNKVEMCSVCDVEKLSRTK